MQVLVLAVQNSVDFSVLGAATSGVTMLRGMGGSLGTALFGAIFTARLTDALRGLPAAGAGGARLTGEQVRRLPAQVRSVYEHAYVHALHPVFLVAAGVAALGFLLSWLLHERPLRATAATSQGLEDTLAAPRAPDSVAEIERALVRCTSRDDRMRFHARVAEHAGVELSPGATWALVRIDEHGFAGARGLAEENGTPPDRIAAVVQELRETGLIAGEDPRVTDRGHAATEAVVAARRELLVAAIADDGAERSPQLDALLRRLARELVGETP